MGEPVTTSLKEGFCGINLTAWSNGSSPLICSSSRKKADMIGGIEVPVVAALHAPTKTVIFDKPIGVVGDPNQPQIGGGDLVVGLEMLAHHVADGDDDAAMMERYWRRSRVVKTEMGRVKLLDERHGPAPDRIADFEQVLIDAGGVESTLGIEDIQTQVLSNPTVTSCSCPLRALRTALPNRHGRSDLGQDGMGTE